MQAIKDLGSSALNQMKYLQDNAFDMQKKSIQYNPMNSMQMQWKMAQLRKNAVFWITLPMVISAVFFDTWISVYSPEGVEYES